MSGTDASTTLAARWARRVLRPIIGILIRAGLPAGEFAAIARSLYVDVASKEFGIRGRRTNTSRIAMLTGLSRTQAKRELDRQESAEDEETEPLDNVRHASRVLLGWHTDARFVTADGQPRALSIEDESDFPLLYESYSGKAVPATSMLKELITVGAVEKLEDGRIMAKARAYTPGHTDPKALFRIGLAISDLATTAHHNLYYEKKKRSRFERFATNQLVEKRHVDAFQDFLEIEAQAFLERADNWLSQRETDKQSDSVVRVGVGVYQVLTDPVVTRK